MLSMKISEEQVQKALEYLHTSDEPRPSPRVVGVSADVLERALAVIDATPDVRDDRVDSAMQMLDGPPSSDEVAQKMIGRIVSDSIR